MANWKSEHTRPRRPNSAGLALVPLSPSPDPVSLLFDAAMTALNFLPHSGSEEANDLVQKYQNPLQNALGAISDRFTAAGSAATAAQLYAWANQVKQLGDKFEAITYNYPNKGPGARATIFGVKNPATGQWEQQPPAAPGYLTGLLNNILSHAREADTMQPQIGFNWDDLINRGISTIDDIFGNDPNGPGGTPYYTPPGSYPVDYYGAQPAAGISTQTLIIGGLLLFFVGPKLLKAFK